MLTTADIGKDGYPPEIIGYAEPWIVAPGDEVAIKVSISLFDYILARSRRMLAHRLAACVESGSYV